MHVICDSEVCRLRALDFLPGTAVGLMGMSDSCVAVVVVAVVPQVCAWVQEGKDVRLGDWSAREIEILNSWQLLTAKPVVYLVNMSAKVGGTA